MHERDIFIAALEKNSDAERAAYLDEACGCGGELRASVESLLREHAQLGNFLESPAPAVLEARRGELDGEGSHLPNAVGTLENKVLGDFRIVREIGRGGMGTVHEAEQIALGRRVALKVLPFAAILDPRQLQRFQNEARAAASLKHPHIVSVYSVGCERGIHYYAMEYVEGRTLAQLVDDLQNSLQPTDMTERVTRLSPNDGCVQSRDDDPTTGSGRLSPAATETKRGARAGESTERTTRVPEVFQTVAQLGVQAAEALDHAHQMGVIHRDIKPSNLLVDVRGNLLITDFGLALTQHDPELTRTGDLVGTLRYMSPEQVRGNRQVVDQRTDIYSLGITLYELLTFRPAFAGENREVLLRQIAEEDPPAPRKVNSAIPRDLETIVLKAIDKEPARRYLTAQEMADDLQRFLANEPIQARRPSVVEYVAKWMRRHRSLVRTGMVSCLAILAISVTSALLVYRAYEREKAEHAIAEQNADEAEKNYQIARDAIRQMLASVSDEELMKNPEIGAIRRHLLKDAAAFCADVMQRNPKNVGADIYELLAGRYLDLEDYENAIAEATKCIQLVRGTPGEAADPRNFDKYSIRAHAYEAQKKYREALSDWDRVVELAPDRPWYYKARALVHFQLQNYDRALADIGKAIELNPADYSTLTWIPPDLVADCPDKHFRQGMLELADKVFRLAPNAPDAYWRRNNLYRAIDKEKARADLDETLQQEPRNVAALLDRATLARSQERWADAIVDCEKAFELQPNDSRVCNSLAWLLCAAGDPSLWNMERAVELAKRAVAISPSGDMEWNTLGVAQYRAGNYEAAKESVEKSIELQSKPGPWDCLAMTMVQWQLGSQEDARRWYQKAKENPSNTRQYSHMRAEAARLLGIVEERSPTEKPPEEAKK